MDRIDKLVGRTIPWMTLFMVLVTFAIVVLRYVFARGWVWMQEIVLYINSPGGSASDGMAVYDAMQSIGSSVSTVCMGMAASMGSVLLAAGARGRRFAWPHARIMIHQPLIMGTITGSSTDLDIRAREIVRLREEINHLYARHTGQDVEKISQDTDRDFFMSAQEARDYGLIDDIITTTTPERNGRQGPAAETD